MLLESGPFTLAAVVDMSRFLFAVAYVPYLYLGLGNRVHHYATYLNLLGDAWLFQQAYAMGSFLVGSFHMMP